MFVYELSGCGFEPRRVLIALSQSDLNLLNEYNSTLTRKLHSAQKCSNEHLILFVADKRKFLGRDFRFRGASYIPTNIISEDNKKRKQVVVLKKVYTMFIIFGH